MKPKQLKALIKPIIRECLTEIFAEMKLESIVESVLRQSQPRQPILAARSSQPDFAAQKKETFVPTLAEATSHQAVHQAREHERQDLINKLGISGQEWSSVYEGTEPINETDVGGPELVTESDLKNSGLYRDYSKFIEDQIK